jgi:hypothetical protein
MVSSHGYAPFFDQDTFWEEAQSFTAELVPVPFDGGLFLVKDDVDPSMGDMLGGDDILRLSIERGSFRYAPLNILGTDNPSIKGWSAWTSSILQNPDFKTRLEKAGVLECVQLCANFSMFRDESALNLLVSRWCSQTSTFVTSWGEFTVTLEDVFEIFRLPPSGSTSYFLPGPSEQDLSRGKGLEKACSASAKYGSRWRDGELSPKGFPSSKSRKWCWSSVIRYFYADFHPSGEEFSSSVLAWLGGENPYQLEAFVAFWLSRFLFGGLSGDKPIPDLFPLACMIARGTSLPLGPMFLGSLYARLGETVSTMRFAKGS